MSDNHYIIKKSEQHPHISECDITLDGNFSSVLVPATEEISLTLWVDANQEKECCNTKDQIEIVVEQDALLKMVVVQNENEQSKHNTLFNIELKRNASLLMSIFTINGNVNNKIEAILTEEGADFELNSLYLGDGERIINNDINLLHKSGGCKSNQLFKGILGGNSKSSFIGDVVVERDAQKTEAYQANKNLLISDSAKAISKPELIIYADDVKCSHGSTIGTLGTEELFYMRSRGITLKQAQILQQQAFAAEVLNKIEDMDLREKLTVMVEEFLEK